MGLPPMMPSHAHDGDRQDNRNRTTDNRIRSVGEFADRRIAVPPIGTPRMVVEIFNGGNIPVVPNKVFLGYPVEVDADDAEGASPSFNQDTGAPIPVIVLNQAAVAGDILVAHAVGGRWVAEKIGCCQLFQVTCNSVPVNGATVTIKSGGTTVVTGTTNSSGDVTLCVPSGSYTVTASGGTCTTTYSNTLNLGCGGSYGLGCCPGCNVTICPQYCWGCTQSATITITNTSGFNTSVTGTGCQTISIPGSGTYTVTISAPGWTTVSQTMTLTCPNTYNFQMSLAATSLSCTVTFPACPGNGPISFTMTKTGTNAYSGGAQYAGGSFFFFDVQLTCSGVSASNSLCGSEGAASLSSVTCNPLFIQGSLGGSECYSCDNGAIITITP